MEKQRDVKLKAKHFENQAPEPFPKKDTKGGDRSPTESKKGILKIKSDTSTAQKKPKRSIRFEDEVPVEELQKFSENLKKTSADFDDVTPPLANSGLDSIDENVGLFDS